MAVLSRVRYRFPSPLVKLDVLISSVHLSDRRHRTAHGAVDLGTRIRICGSASSLRTSPKENPEVPHPLTHLQRKFRTRS